MRARTRCREVAVSEKLLGYMESAMVYEDIADELQNLYLWVVGEVQDCWLG